MSSNHLIGKPPNKFCKEKISDSPEPRIILTNDYTLPLKRSMCYFFMTRSEVSLEYMLRRKHLKNLLQPKHAGLTSFRWPQVLIDDNFYSNCSMQRIRVFLRANEPTLHRLVSQRHNNSFLTLSLMQSPWKWADLELQKFKMSQALKSKKKCLLFLYIHSSKLETTLTPILNETILFYTILPSHRNLTYLWLCPSFGFSS